MTTSKALVLIAHGSRKQAWLQAFTRLHQEIAEALTPEIVRLAYMEIATPTLKDVVRTLEAQGVRRILVLPLFMAGGGHVDHDIPQQIRDIQADFETVHITQAPAVGEHTDVIRAISAVAASLLTNP